MSLLWGWSRCLCSECLTLWWKEWNNFCCAALCALKVDVRYCPRRQLFLNLNASLKFFETWFNSQVNTSWEIRMFTVPVIIYMLSGAKKYESPFTCIRELFKWSQFGKIMFQFWPGWQASCSTAKVMAAASFSSQIIRLFYVHKQILWNGDDVMVYKSLFAWTPLKYLSCFKTAAIHFGVQFAYPPGQN